MSHLTDALEHVTLEVRHRDAAEQSILELLKDWFAVCRERLLAGVVTDGGHALMLSGEDQVTVLAAPQESRPELSSAGIGYLW